MVRSIPISLDEAGSAQDFMAEARTSVNRVLRESSVLVEQELNGAVGAAISYSLSNPGKGLRPALVMAAYRELGGDGDASSLAAAVEVVHTYSLVHDDLPCMDNDELRRGRLTTHRKFDVPTATEAGFRMVSLAARLLASGAARLNLQDEELGAIGSELFRAAGAVGMIGGQVLDLEAEGRSVSAEELARIHRWKTGALITASAVIGAIAARATTEAIEAVRAYGKEIGLAFQIVDDVLDATGSAQELGKTVGKDAVQQKATFATIFGEKRARAEAVAHVEQAVQHLGEGGKGGIDSTLLSGIALFILNRRY